MSERPLEGPVDDGAIRGDDLLLDALGRGAEMPADDEVAAMLAAWRRDLTAEPAPHFSLAAPAAPAAEADPAPAAGIDPDPDAETATGAETATEPRRAVRRGPSRSRTFVLAAAFVVIASLGGVSVAALHATPGSPLWPVSQVLNPERAAALDVRHSLDQASAATAAHRYPEAARWLDRAQAQLTRVTAKAEAARLQAELNSLRSLLADATGTAGTPGGGGGAPGAPGASPSPPAATSGAGQPPTKAPGGSNPAPTQGSGGGPKLPIPSLPVPSLPVPSLPVPSLPIPSLPVPKLPLPSLPVHLP
jgi:hypothetical protein